MQCPNGNATTTFSNLRVGNEYRCKVIVKTPKGDTKPAHADDKTRMPEEITLCRHSLVKMGLHMMNMLV